MHVFGWSACMWINIIWYEGETGITVAPDLAPKQLKVWICHLLRWRNHTEVFGLFMRYIIYKKYSSLNSRITVLLNIGRIQSHFPSPFLLGHILMERNSRQNCTQYLHPCSLSTYDKCVNVATSTRITQLELGKKYNMLDMMHRIYNKIFMCYFLFDCILCL